MKVDLHTHSTASDGQYSPAELVGLDVDWDGATHTVKLGNNMKAVDLIDDIGAYYLQKVNGNAYAFQHKSSESLFNIF